MKTLVKVLALFVLLGCVQETHLKTVTFRVDMTEVNNPENIGVRGNFTSNPWTETLTLSDDDGDGIFEGSFSQKTAANQIQFKFVNQNDFELQGNQNRVLEFVYEPETIIYSAIFNNEKDVQIIKK